jgi:diguanylate cyclase (GGDEF)-like protein/PAS domain S-box-containing protein
MSDVAEVRVESTFEELWEHAPCGHLTTRLDGSILRVNGTLLRWLGFDRDSLAEAVFTDLLEAGGRLFYETRQRPVLMLQGEMREISMRLRCADGSVLPVLVNSVVVQDAAGEPSEIRTAVFDSTERHQYERELIDARRSAELSADRVRALQDATSAFAASEDEPAVVQALTEAVRGAVAAAAVAALREHDDGSLEIVGGVHLLDEIAPGTRWAAYDEALASMEHVAISHPSEADDETAQAMRAARIESFTVLPVRNDAGVRGLIVSFFGRQRELSEAAVDLKLSITKQAMQTLKTMRLQRQLEQLALYDELTGLANRKLLQEQLSLAIASALRDGTSLALMFIDLDGFKAVNDQIGHAAGDDVLRGVADRLRGVVRQNDLVGRLGGDEFVVICETVDQESARAVAERILEAIRQPYDGIPAALPVSASVGVVLSQPAGHSVPTSDELLTKADAAMYTSKNSGRDRITIELV